MPNLRSKTWTTTTPANVEDAQYWEDHLISDADALKITTSVQSVNNTTPDAQGNVDIVALPSGGTAGQVLTKQSSAEGDADWEDPASSGHTIIDEHGDDMPYRTNLQFTNAEVTDDSVNDTTIVDCKGEKGDKGDAATITIGTTTTLPAGSSATVTNTGTSSAAVFNFGIPKGADGTGAGDMLKADYDANSAVYNAGGIAAYVAGQAYSLPTASSSTLGGVKVGTNLSISDGVLSATNTDSLSGLTDTSISIPSAGQVLKYNATSSKWENAAESTGSSTLSGLSDVSLTSLSANQFLRYNATSQKWENYAGDTILTATLSAGSTTVTFTDASIGNNSTIIITTDPYGVVPTAATQSGTTVTLTFDEQTVAVGVKIVVKN